MPALRDLLFQQFGRLIVVSESQQRNKCGHAAWLCLCECGNETTVTGVSLTRGITQSCGCLQREVARNTSGAANPFFKHGESNSPEWVSWSAMIYRCTNPSSSNWKGYGARGITVCERWQGEHGFENFLADMGSRPGKSYSLDRINNDGHYEPGNVRWATRSQQNSNRRMTPKFLAALERMRQKRVLAVAA